MKNLVFILLFFVSQLFGQTLPPVYEVDTAPTSYSLKEVKHFIEHLTVEKGLIGSGYVVLDNIRTPITIHCDTTPIDFLNDCRTKKYLSLDKYEGNDVLKVEATGGLCVKPLLIYSGAYSFMDIRTDGLVELRWEGKEGIRVKLNDSIQVFTKKGDIYQCRGSGSNKCCSIFQGGQWSLCF